MNMQDLAQLVNLASKELPAVEAIVQGLEAFGPLIRRVAGQLAIAHIDIKADAVQHLVGKRDFSVDDAISLVNSEWATIARNIQQAAHRQSGGAK